MHNEHSALETPWMQQSQVTLRPLSVSHVVCLMTFSPTLTMPRHQNCWAVRQAWLYSFFKSSPKPMWVLAHNFQRLQGIPQCSLCTCGMRGMLLTKGKGPPPRECARTNTHPKSLQKVPQASTHGLADLRGGLAGLHTRNSPHTEVTGVASQM